MVVTTRNIDVVLLLEGEVLHNIVSPLCAWEANGIAAVTELLDNCIREWMSQTIVVAHLIVEEGVVKRTGLLYHLSRAEC